MRGCSREVTACVCGNTTPRTWVHDLPQMVRTGDVVLFSSSHAGSKLIKYCTASEWDHVGMVVKTSPNRVHILEWAGGLFAVELVPRLIAYHKAQARTLAVRRLKLPERLRPLIEERLEKFVYELFRKRAGQNRMIPVDNLLKAFRAESATPRASNRARAPLAC